MAVDLDSLVTRSIFEPWRSTAREDGMALARAVAEALVAELESQKEMVEFEGGEQGGYLGYAIPLRALGMIRLEINKGVDPERKG